MKFHACVHELLAHQKHCQKRKKKQSNTSRPAAGCRSGTFLTLFFYHPVNSKNTKYLLETGGSRCPRLPEKVYLKCIFHFTVEVFSGL